MDLYARICSEISAHHYISLSRAGNNIIVNIYGTITPGDLKTTISIGDIVIGKLRI